MISSTALHAVRALSQLAELPEGDYSGAGALARAVEAPANYLGKLLQELARWGLLESRKGLGGGFRLARPAAAISLLEIVEPIDQLGRWQGCLLGRPECSEDAPCAIHDEWAKLRAGYLALLEHTRLEDLRGARGPLTASDDEPARARPPRHGRKT
ncbi:MAG: Rrf2 family transcriptional regulator [Acidobacteriota bacterium]|nr:MAG: Rrf2 family transcriptional regulator [Acidobacteriota bacterium]